MSVAAMLAEAQKWVDAKYRESPGNHTPFGEWYGDNGEPWCDQFVSYCGDKSGNGAAVGKFQYCPSHVNWFKAQRQWGSTPKVGAIVFYDWDGDGLADHVGIVKSFTDTDIRTLEGNTSSGDAGSQGNGDGAYERVRPRYRNIIGYGYPAYSEEPAAPSKPAPAPAKPPAGPAWPGEYLRVKSPMLHDDHVRTWQQQMRNRGWSIAVDGWYGQASAEVCRKFQAEKRLTVDGIVGPATWSAAWNAPIR